MLRCSTDFDFSLAPVTQLTKMDIVEAKVIARKHNAHKETGKLDDFSVNLLKSVGEDKEGTTLICVGRNIA